MAEYEIKKIKLPNGDICHISGGGGGDVIESISVNGTNIPPDANKNVNLTVPEDVSFYIDAQGYLCQRIRSDT